MNNKKQQQEPQPNIFWDWFLDNVEQLTMLNDIPEDDSTRLRNDLQKQLDAYCEGLTYEISEQNAQGRTLTFSAEGDFDLFRYVVALTDNAPDVDWWEFVAFKQPKGRDLKVLFDKYRYETSKMAFMQLENEEEPDILGLRIAMPGLPADFDPEDPAEDDRFVGAYVTIEALIGEFDCTTLIGYVDLCPMPKEPFKAGFRPLDDLPEFVEWFKSRRD